MNNKRIFNCDIFCFQPSIFDGDVRITGNFYSQYDIIVKGTLEVGGDIILDSPDGAVIIAASIRAVGKISTHNFEVLSPDICSVEDFSSRYDGPADLIMEEFDFDEFIDGPDGEYNPSDL